MNTTPYRSRDHRDPQLMGLVNEAKIKGTIRRNLGGLKAKLPQARHPQQAGKRPDP
jgi:hypothetical protein